MYSEDMHEGKINGSVTKFVSHVPQPSHQF